MLVDMRGEADTFDLTAGPATVQIKDRWIPLFTILRGVVAWRQVNAVANVEIHRRALESGVADARELAFQLVDPHKKGSVPEQHIKMITMLLNDDPRNLCIREEWICAGSITEQQPML